MSVPLNEQSGQQKSNVRIVKLIIERRFKMKKIFSFYIVVAFGCLVVWPPDVGAEKGEAI